MVAGPRARAIWRQTAPPPRPVGRDSSSGGRVHPLQRIQGWLFPPACRQCGRLLPPPGHGRAGPPAPASAAALAVPDAPPPAGYPFLCAACHGALPWLPDAAALAARAAPPGLVRVAAACHYREPVSRWIQHLKYERREGLVRLLAALLHESPAGAAALQGVDWVVPVPLHPWRLWQRGFNQSLLVAHAWLRAAGAASGAGGASLPRLAADVLVRHRYTRPQVRVPGAERQANVAGAFSLHPRLAGHPEALQGRRVLLLDDVTTTGATLSACAGVLLAGGAERVEALVLARA
jgi:ComF family protein